MAGGHIRQQWGEDLCERSEKPQLPDAGLLESVSQSIMDMICVDETGRLGRVVVIQCLQGWVSLGLQSILSQDTPSTDGL